MDLLSHFGVSPSIGFHAPLRTWAMMPLSASRVTKVLSLGNFGLWGEIVPDYKTRMWSPWASPAAGGGVKTSGLAGLGLGVRRGGGAPDFASGGQPVARSRQDAPRRVREP